MQHTYLRYECADAFALTTSSSSSNAPQSNSILAFVGTSARSSTLLTTAGSQCVGFDLRGTSPVLKIGHRERLSGGVGTGRALNSDEVVCLDVASSPSSGGAGDDGEAEVVGDARVATGWVDGAVRVFALHRRETAGGMGLVHSLLRDPPDDEDGEDGEFITREPLVLRGHGSSPVRCVAFDKVVRRSCDGDGSGVAGSFSDRLASGGSDGAVVLWDVVAECGLYRLLGHKGAITDVAFIRPSDGRGGGSSGGGPSSSCLDGLVTSSLDGLVKVWDLGGQCCVQTIANHRGEVTCLAASILRTSTTSEGGQNSERWRLITGSAEGQVRVWMVLKPTRSSVEGDNDSYGERMDERLKRGEPISGEQDDACYYMGSLIPPPNVSTSNEKIASVHFHPNGQYVGVCRSNSKAIDLYLVRSALESQKKKQRRMRRRREKQSVKESSAKEAGGRKRGILDDPESSGDEKEKGFASSDFVGPDGKLIHEMIKAGDEFEYQGSVRASHKIKGFAFAPYRERGGGIRVVCALATNALEVHSLSKARGKAGAPPVVVTEKVSSLDMYGHPTGIRSITLSSDDVLACTVSKNAAKIWNVASRSCLRSMPLNSGGKTNVAYYGLCATFLPGNTHVVIGTREGHLLILDIASGDIVYTEDNAHDGAIWSLDLRRPNPEQSMALVTGSADKTVKFWDVDRQDSVDESLSQHPMAVHTRTLQMSDDVVAVRYSHATDPAKRMVFISTLDCTIKVFFDDTLRLNLSLYGHKLPALALDASDDDTILASAGADKSIKIWGLDFGDTHRTLHGHTDSVTDLRFVGRTHNFFTTGKDGTLRYWDGDRFEQILLLHGHTAEVNCLAMSRTGAFVLSGGMDRQIRVWERTKDIVFLEEEREREMEEMFDKVDGSRGDEGTAALMKRGQDDEDQEIDGEGGNEQPESEAAVKRSVLSVSSGDRIMEAIDRADQEMKDIAIFKKSQQVRQKDSKHRMPNPLLLGMEPPQYILWVLRSVKSADLEQSLLVLPLKYMERLIYYLIILLRSGRGVEICSRAAIFLIKSHQTQIVANHSLVSPLRELRRLVKARLAETRDTVGFNLAALRAIARISSDKKDARFVQDGVDTKDIWAELGLGSDVAAALEKKGASGNKRR